MLLAEIGAEQGEAVRELFAENGFSGIRVIRDLAGRDRVVTGIRPQDGRI
jgi:release factor glutamine methyltransferase